MLPGHSRAADPRIPGALVNSFIGFSALEHDLGHTIGWRDLYDFLKKNMVKGRAQGPTKWDCGPRNY